MKFFWASDDVPEMHVSRIFHINQVADSEEVEDFTPDYPGRFLSFKLFFDAPVVLSGNKITSCGRMVGNGIWSHQENRTSLSELNQTHPDFIWMPTQMAQGSGSGYRNPYILNENVVRIFEARGHLASAPAPIAHDMQTLSAPSVLTNDSLWTFQLRKADFGNLPDVEVSQIVKDKLKAIFAREGFRTLISLADIKVSGEEISARVKFMDLQSEDRVRAALTESGIHVDGATL